ncbi:MAG: TetR/AcrR family transcriptional regulator [Psychroflexus halocasei]|nr:TetR/AcrR family transcriptional regulator [Psychroflexus sp.]MDN6310491.1 TetR/AcrR family transcriptional regulator [Psychroflexus sp.]
MRNQIIRKATEMFLELGFKSVTMDDLAHELSVSKKTIYDLVGKKSTLVELVVQSVIAEIDVEMSDVSSQEFDAITEMFAFRDIVVKRLRNQKASPQFQLKKYYPKIYDKYRGKQIDIMSQNIKNNILKGVKEAHYDDLSIDFVVNLYIVGLLDIKNDELLNVEQYTQKQLYHEFVLYHLRSVTTQKGQWKMNEILKT